MENTYKAGMKMIPMVAAISIPPAIGIPITYTAVRRHGSPLGNNQGPK